MSVLFFIKFSYNEIYIFFHVRPPFYHNLTYPITHHHPFKYMSLCIKRETKNTKLERVEKKVALVYGYFYFNIMPWIIFWFENKNDWYSKETQGGRVVVHLGWEGLRSWYFFTPVKTNVSTTQTTISFVNYQTKSSPSITHYHFSTHKFSIFFF